MLCIIVFYGWDHGLDKFQKDQKIPESKVKEQNANKISKLNKFSLQTMSIKKFCRFIIIIHGPNFLRQIKDQNLFKEKYCKMINSIINSGLFFLFSIHHTEIFSKKISLLHRRLAFFPRKFHKKDGLVSLFNGISTYIGYLMPKLFS